VANPNAILTLTLTLNRGLILDNALANASDLLEAVTIADLTVSIVWVFQIVDLTSSILSYR